MWSPAPTTVIGGWTAGIVDGDVGWIARVIDRELVTESVVATLVAAETKLDVRIVVMP